MSVIEWFCETHHSNEEYAHSVAAPVLSSRAETCYGGAQTARVEGTDRPAVQFEGMRPRRCRPSWIWRSTLRPASAGRRWLGVDGGSWFPQDRDVFS